MWPFSRSRPGLTPRAAVKSLDVGEAYQRMRKGAKLIDVRSPREFQAAHPKGGRHVSPERIHADQVGLGRDQEIMVICLSGHRSGRHAKNLTKLGYTDVANVRGGLRAWARAGLPVKER